MTDNDNTNEQNGLINNLSRRTALGLMGAGVVGGTAATGAFSKLTADRPIDVSVEDGSNAVFNTTGNNATKKINVTNQIGTGETVNTTVTPGGNYTLNSSSSSSATITNSSGVVEVSGLADGDKAELEFKSDDPVVDFDIRAYSNTNGFEIQLNRPIGFVDTDALLKLDAQAINASDGDTVSTWSDQSGQGNDATNGNATYNATGLNNKPAVDVTGTGFDVPTFMNGKSAGEALLVLRMTGNAGSRQGVPFDYGDGTQSEHYSYSNGDVFTAWGRDSRLTEASPKITNNHILNLRSGTNFVAQYNDSAYIDTTDGSVDFSTSSPEIGRDVNTGFDWPGVIAEVVTYDKVLTSTERAVEYARLADKWDLSL